MRLVVLVVTFCFVFHLPISAEEMPSQKQLAKWQTAIALQRSLADHREIVIDADWKAFSDAFYAWLDEQEEHAWRMEERGATEYGFSLVDLAEYLHDRADSRDQILHMYKENTTCREILNSLAAVLKILKDQGNTQTSPEPALLILDKADNIRVDLLNYSKERIFRVYMRRLMLSIEVKQRDWEELRARRQDTRSWSMLSQRFDEALRFVSLCDEFAKEERRKQAEIERRVELLMNPRLERIKKRLEELRRATDRVK